MRKIKEFKPSYKVDLSEIETLSDIDFVWALSKHNANIALSDKELLDIIDWVITNLRPNITMVVECVEKEKLPWYKRLWNWITRK